MSEAPTRGFLASLYRWFEGNVLALGREMRLTFLPPLMVYVAAGVSGLTGIVGTFYVKERLGLSAEFLAALGFWAGIPWALKMPVGHLVDLIWRHKAGLVYLGAGLIAASLAIMIGLLVDPATMQKTMRIEAWYVLAVLLSPIGYVLQDVVADAMTVEAVPRLDEHGQPFSEEARRSMHTTMQTLGRIAIIGGGLLVALANVVLLGGADALAPVDKAALYAFVYKLALIIPVVSVLGVLFAGVLRRRDAARMRARGLTADQIDAALWANHTRPPVNGWILGGGLAFAVISIAVGVADFNYGQELIFLVSMAIVLFLIYRLLGQLEPAARHTLIGTALVIFVFRATPGSGAGATWWMIDVLKFDQQFLALLSLIGSALTLVGLFLFRRFMAERSIVYVVGALAIAGAVLALPTIGMFYGLHHWTAAMTGGMVDARTIAIVDTTLSSPLGQVAMVPMLAWIANSAPEQLKATYFAVMASFTNLALSAAELGTKYLNRLYVVTREVKNASGTVTTPQDYSQLGELLIVVTLVSLAATFLAILFVKTTRFRSA